MILLKIVELVLPSKMSNFDILGWKLHIYDIQFIFCWEAKHSPTIPHPHRSKQAANMRACCPVVGNGGTFEFSSELSAAP